MSDFLSQDEVDSLLKGVTGEADENAGNAEADAGEVRPYNLASQERIVRGRMPTMEIINERFARLFRIGLFNLVRRTPEDFRWAGARREVLRVCSKLACAD